MLGAIKICLGSTQASWSTNLMFPYPFYLIRQRKRVFVHERDNAIVEEARKLLDAGFIREVYYPEWLANVVMVKKAKGKWRIRVDFTDLIELNQRIAIPSH